MQNTKSWTWETCKHFMPFSADQNVIEIWKMSWYCFIHESILKRKCYRIVWHSWLVFFRSLFVVNTNVAIHRQKFREWEWMIVSLLQIMLLGIFFGQSMCKSDHLVVKTSLKNYGWVWCFICTCLVSNMFSLVSWPVEMACIFCIRY